MQVFKPVLNKHKILKEMGKILDSGWIGLGPKVKEFEDELCTYTGAQNAVCLNSCTSALHLAVKSLRLPPGARVLTTPITFISTNHVLLYEGLTPIFCDVEKYTGNMDFEEAQKIVRNYPIDAIVLVHNGGYPCDMEKFNWLAKSFNIPIIEDCAHAFGAIYENGKKVGNSDNLCCFSFHAVKNLPCGDGGAIISNKLPEKWLKKMRWLGIDKDTVSRTDKGYSWEYSVEHVGYKYHMNDITAVIGLAQLETITEDNMVRAEIARYYINNINFVGFDLHHPPYDNQRVSSYHFYPIFSSKVNKIYDALVKNGIYPGMHYKRSDSHPVYAKYHRPCENATEYHNTELTLPIHLELSTNDLKKIVEVVNEAIVS